MSKEWLEGKQYCYYCCRPDTLYKIDNKTCKCNSCQGEIEFVYCKCCGEPIVNPFPEPTYGRDVCEKCSDKFGFQQIKCTECGYETKIRVLPYENQHLTCHRCSHKISISPVLSIKTEEAKYKKKEEKK